MTPETKPIDFRREIALPQQDINPLAYDKPITETAKKRDSLEYGLGGVDCMNKLEKGEPVFVDDVIDAVMYFAPLSTRDQIERKFHRNISDETATQLLHDRERLLELASKDGVIKELTRRVRECSEALNDPKISAIDAYLASEDIKDIALISTYLSEHDAQKRDEHASVEERDGKYNVDILLFALVDLPLNSEARKGSKWTPQINNNLDIAKFQVVEAYFNYQYPPSHITEFVRRLILTSQEDPSMLNRFVEEITQRHIWPNITIHDIQNKIRSIVFPESVKDLNLREDLPEKASSTSFEILKTFPNVDNNVIARLHASLWGIFEAFKQNVKDGVNSRNLKNSLPGSSAQLRAYSAVPLFGTSKEIEEIRYLLDKVFPQMRDISEPE